jgi:hypothetical protein
MSFARRLVLVATAIGILSAVTAGAAGAADICWNGPNSGGDWATPTNWRGGVVPGVNDTARLNGISGGCNNPADVTVRADASIGQLSMFSDTLKVTSRATLTITGTNASGEGVQSLDVADGSRVVIAAGAHVNAGGGWNLNTTGAVTVNGTLESAFTSIQFRGGTLTIAAGGVLHAGEYTQLGMQDTRFDMQGTVDLTTPATNGGGSFFFKPSADSPASAGTWIGNKVSDFVPQVIGGSTFTITGPVSGRWEPEYGNAGNGPAITRFAGGASCLLTDVTVYGYAGLQVDRDCSVSGTFKIFNSSYRYAGRSGTGTLTAARAEIDGGGFLDAGLTRVTGDTNIIGNSGGPAIYNGATLRTEGATTWQQGYVTLGASNQTGPGTWENAGALRIDNTNANDQYHSPLGLLDYSPDLRSGGVLKNLAGATITRTAPTGTFPISARIENAGTLDVQAGAMGGSFGAAFPTGSLVQSGGVTRVAAGATLDLDTTLNGGTLKGNGTVRSVANPGGTVAPGESPGALTIASTFTQGPGGTLLEDIAGTDPASFDRLVVTGAATLGGTVKIVKDPAYSPANGDTYNILTAASRSGEFAGLSGDAAGFAASYRADGASLTYGGGGGAPPGGGGGGGTTTPPVVTGTGGGGGTSSGGSGATTTTRTPVTGSGGTTTPPAPRTTAPAPRTVAVTSIATLPSARSCVSRRDFTIRLRVPKGRRVTSAEVRVAGRRSLVLKGRRLTARVKLTGLPKGTFKVTITLTLSTGSKLQGARTYHTCAPRKAS